MQFREAIMRLLKSPSMGMLAIFTGGNLMAAVLGGLGGLIQAHFISPEVFGEFRKYGILTTYFAIGTVFVHDGLCRQFPYYLGAGDKDRALKIAGVAKTWYAFATVVFSAFFVCMAGIAALKCDWNGVLGWLTQVAVVMGTIYGAFLTVMYRTSSDFKRLSYNTVISSIIAFLLLLPVKLWGFVGLVVRMVGTNLCTLWINTKYLPVRVKMRFDWKELRSLMGMSLRFSIPGYLDTSALSATFNAMLLFSCGEGAVGLYGFALALYSFVTTFNTSLTQIFNVKINLRYGATKDFRGCVRYAALPALCAVGVSILLYVVSVFMADPFVRYLLPKYVESIPVINVLFLSIIVSSMYLPLTLTRAAAMYNAVYAQCAGQIGTAAILLWLMPHDPASMAWIQVLSGLGNCVGGYFFVIRKYIGESNNGKSG